MRQLLGDHGNFVFSVLGIRSSDYDSRMNADFIKVNIGGFLLIGARPDSNKISMNVSDGYRWRLVRSRRRKYGDQAQSLKEKGQETRRMHDVRLVRERWYSMRPARRCFR